MPIEIMWEGARTTSMCRAIRRTGYALIPCLRRHAIALPQGGVMRTELILGRCRGRISKRKPSEKEGLQSSGLRLVS
jgi:hypothetical protein